MKNKELKAKEKGYILIAAVSFILILTISTLAFLSFSSYENAAVEREVGEVYALNYAETGISRANDYLEQYTKDIIGVVSVPEVNFKENEYGRGKVHSILIKPIGNPKDKLFEIEAVGSFLPHSYEEKGWGPIERKIRYTTKRKTWGDYFYITDDESSPGWADPAFSTVRFWNQDEIHGPLHTNGMLHIRSNMGAGPVFWNDVTSVSEQMEIIQQGGYPVFKEGYTLGVDPIEFPYTAKLVKENAQRTFSYDELVHDGHELKINILFRSNGTMRVIRTFVEDGLEDLYDGFPDTLYHSFQTPGHLNKDRGSIYVEGIAEVSGRVKGDVTIGAVKNIRIMDDLVYADSNMSGGVGSKGKPPEGCQNYLGLISEQNVMIANTWENRSDNHGICINAGIIALGDHPTSAPTGTGDWDVITVGTSKYYSGGSFSVEDMNTSLPRTPDQYMQALNNLTIYGAVAQRYRGYVHRTNSYGTGDDGGYFDKDYHYDKRFEYHPPPDYIEVSGLSGYEWSEVTYEYILEENE